MTRDWCAGFFDGEGSVGCWTNGLTSSTGIKFRVLRASIVQKVRGPLDKFAEITGLGKVRGPYTGKRGFTDYRLELNSSDTLKLYSFLKGRLVLKQGQFEDAIRQYIEYRKTIPSRTETQRIFKERLLSTGLRDN